MLPRMLPRAVSLLRPRGVGAPLPVLARIASEWSARRLVRRPERASEAPEQTRPLVVRSGCARAGVAAVGPAWLYDGAPGRSGGTEGGLEGVGDEVGVARSCPAAFGGEAEVDGGVGDEDVHGVGGVLCADMGGKGAALFEFAGEGVEVGATGGVGVVAVFGELGVAGGGGLGERDDRGGAVHQRGVEGGEAREHLVEWARHDRAPFGPLGE